MNDPDKWEVRIMDHGYGVYRWSDNIPYGTFSQREHAVLFAASPCLLATCKRLLEFLDRLEDSWGSRELKREAREVLAKAEGRE